MRVLSYAWSLAVTWKRRRSHHSIRHSRKPTLHANFMARCVIESELIADRIFTLRELGFSTFVLPWLLSWPDDFHTRTWTWPVFPGNVLDERKWTSYVKAFESYRLTDRQTWRTLYRPTGGRKSGTRSLLLLPYSGVTGGEGDAPRVTPSRGGG